VMLVLDMPDGKQHPQLPPEAGTYDWTTKTRTMRIPAAAIGATLSVGLELVSGKASFDNITIVTGRLATGGKRSEVMDRGHDLDRLRGSMHGPVFREEDFRALATDFGANHMRWQLNWVPMKAAEEWATDIDAYNEWLDGALEECDKAIALAEELNVVLLVDLHCPPGGRKEGGVCRMFQEKHYQDLLLDSWRKIATRYKGREVVWAYDIINEPVEGRVGEGLMNWRDLATAAAELIREIDPGKPIVVEPGPWGGPGGFDNFVPLDMDGIIYSCHMYIPHQFTHQGVHGSDVDVAYPGIIGGEQWDKDRLKEALAPARDFQLAYNVPMYIGEFSAIRWAPDNSAFRYLRDVIDIFEEYEWDWAYHAFREWSGWSVEHGTDPKDTGPAADPTDREKLLRGWLAKNERP
ncbi:MAG TPA: cellulase family glycosylhydrolase, partial [Armatimonadota bacterium]|nr:cellulase family glycosylhydrolase [Armatimonadota bacterium]